jgi:hypothetical protein
LWSSTTHNTEDIRPNIIDALLTFIFRMWLGAWICILWTSRRLIRQTCTVTYQCQYHTISSSISECDHECGTRNAEPHIGTDGSDHIRRNLLVARCGSGFGLWRVRMSGFWMSLELNLPVFVFQTPAAGGLPGHVGNTKHTSNRFNTQSKLRYGQRTH